jgi:hypothetical protein
VVTLNIYSRQVLRAFLDLLPELEPYAHCAEGGVLDITVPHPKIESGLHVTAAGGEVSIGFREWHTHADLLAAGSEKDVIAVAGGELPRRQFPRCLGYFRRRGRVDVGPT